MIDALLIATLLYGAGSGLHLETCNQDMACSHEPVDRKKITKLTASSTLKDAKNRYAAEMVLDSDESTAWCEGKNGPGVGESLVIELSEPVLIDRVLITPMYAKSLETVSANNRVKKLVLELD